MISYLRYLFIEAIFSPSLAFPKKAEPLPFAEKWCDGGDDEEMPLRQASKDEYLQSRLRKIQWVVAEAAEENAA